MEGARHCQALQLPSRSHLSANATSSATQQLAHQQLHLTENLGAQKGGGDVSRWLIIPVHVVLHIPMT